MYNVQLLLFVYNYSQRSLNKLGDKMKKEEWKNLSKKQWEIELKVLLRTNDKALIKGVLAVYDSQTYEEKAVKQSKEENNIGFTKKDAKLLSNIAEKIKQTQKVSRNDLIVLRNRMPKYWKQLMNISLHKIEEQEQVQIAAKEKQRELEQRIKKDFMEEIERCECYGIPCSYGICDECILSDVIRYR